MRDPQVECLIYRLQPSDTCQYVDAPRLEGETGDFSYVLDNGALTFHMKKHCACADEAKALVAGFLFVWELDAALRFGRGAVRFVYESAQVVDRIPPPPGTLELNLSETIHFGAEFGACVIRTAYPEPPSNMKATPDLETLWTRYEGCRAEREPLSSMAYFCLTVLDTSAGGRAEAARQYNIDLDVLRKIGELTANRGDGATARKMQANLVPYTPLETKWIEEAIGVTIRRVAEIGAGTTGAKITMKDLPDL